MTPAQFAALLGGRAFFLKFLTNGKKRFVIHLKRCIIKPWIDDPTAPRVQGLEIKMAAYRNITLTSTTVEWQGSSGTVFAVTVVLNRAETDYFGNADWQPVRDGLQISTAATIDGVEHRQGVDGLRKLDKPVGAVTHAVGRIGIADAEIVAKIEAARAVAKAHPAWVAKTAAFDRGIAADRAYTAHVAAVNKMMMPGGSY